MCLNSEAIIASDDCLISPFSLLKLIHNNYLVISCFCCLCVHGESLRLILDRCSTLLPTVAELYSLDSRLTSNGTEETIRAIKADSLGLCRPTLPLLSY